MKTTSGNSTHGHHPVDPHQFRAQATGIGQTRSASQATGAVRTARVCAVMPQRQAAALPPCSGYAPYSAADGGTNRFMPGMPMV